jgi:hypothetical protein
MTCVHAVVSAPVVTELTNFESMAGFERPEPVITSMAGMPEDGVPNLRRSQREPVQPR